MAADVDSNWREGKLENEACSLLKSRGEKKSPWWFAVRGYVTSCRSSGEGMNRSVSGVKKNASDMEEK